MMIKEMRQLLDKGIFLFIDPAHLLYDENFEVVININDVCKVAAGEEGMDINHLLTTLTRDGNYGDLPEVHCFSSASARMGASAR